MPLTIESVAHVLKRETREQHEAVEAVLHPLLMNINSMDDYARILETFFGFFHPVQETISAFVTPDDLDDIAERRHASLIIDDLTSLECPFYPAVCTELPVIDTKPAAFGALYVLEGSTLGGRMIYKMLLKNQQVLLTANNLRFFNGYGDRTGQKWQFFIQALDQQEDISTIVEAANNTFLHLNTWVRKSLYDTAIQ